MLLNVVEKPSCKGEQKRATSNKIINGNSFPSKFVTFALSLKIHVQQPEETAHTTVLRDMSFRNHCCLFVHAGVVGCWESYSRHRDDQLNIRHLWGSSPPFLQQQSCFLSLLMGSARCCSSRQSTFSSSLSSTSHHQRRKKT